jgi:hypothetical protein
MFGSIDTSETESTGASFCPAGNPGIGIWFSGPGAERLLPGLLSERKRTFDQLFRSLQNPRAAVNAVLGFSRWFERVLGFRVAGPGARKQERAVSKGSLGAQKGW